MRVQTSEYTAVKHTQEHAGAPIKGHTHNPSIPTNIQSIMASHGNTLTTALFVTLIMFFSTFPSANGAVFREYIGALYKEGVKLSDVPINPKVNVHLILAFAIDYTSDGRPTDGNFKEYWDTGNITPESVAAIKSVHPNVKVAVSIGGDTVHGVPVKFSASSSDAWINNAVRSLTAIIQKYHLDGIDIDYEHFNTDALTFSRSVGGLISRLKSNRVIQFASIAPFDPVRQQYTTLWNHHAADIDFVNFQFYSYEISTTVDQFLSHYNDVKSQYKDGHVIVSFSTDQSGGLKPGKGFFKACQTLKDRKQLDGIFVWCADASKASGFQYEPMAQSILL